MTISIIPPAASRARALVAKQPNLTPEEIHRILGIPLVNVKSALAAKPRVKPKKRLSARV
jgi:hypothetical protein